MALYDLLNVFKHHSNSTCPLTVPIEVKKQHPVLKYLKEYEWAFIENVVNTERTEEEFIEFMEDHKYMFFIVRTLLARLKKAVRDKEKRI